MEHPNSLLRKCWVTSTISSGFFPFKPLYVWRDIRLGHVWLPEGKPSNPFQMGAFPATAWAARMPLATCIGFVPWRWWLDWCSVGLAASWRTMTQLKICKILQASKIPKDCYFCILLYACVILNTTLFLRGFMIDVTGWHTRPRRPRLCGLDVHHTLDAHRARDFGWRAADANNYFNCCWAKYVEAYYYSKEV